MAGKKTLAITDRQYTVLNVLWREGPLTVRELMGHLPGGAQQPYTTVLGMVQNMEKLGLLTHEREGATHRYVPVMGKQEATGKLVKDFLNRFFGGSTEALVAGLVDAEAISPQDLKELEGKLAASQAKTSQAKASKRKS